MFEKEQLKVILQKIEKIAVVGLGYVGLPLGVALGKFYETIGYDKSPQRIRELQKNNDRTGEVTSDVQQKSKLKCTSNVGDIVNADVYIVTVPTPVDESNSPELTAVMDCL